MKEQVYSKIVLDFLASTVEYCNFLEDSYGNYEEKEMLVEISKQLTKLYLNYLNLPEFSANTEDIELEEFVTEADYNFIFSRLEEKFGDNNFYLDLNDPLTLEYQEAVGASLAEYLADIYQAVKNYNTHYKIKSNEQILFLSNAACIEECKNYWGSKLISATRAIHLITNKK